MKSIASKKTKITIKNIKSELDKQMNAIAKERDNLDIYILEANMLLENCDSALEHLQVARDALSELV